MRAYVSHGDRAPIEYRDQFRQVRLEDDYRSLLEASLYINDFAPELGKDLKYALSWESIQTRGLAGGSVHFHLSIAVLGYSYLAWPKGCVNTLDIL